MRDASPAFRGGGVLWRFLCLAAALAACVPKIIPDNVMEKVDASLTYAVVARDPEAHRGKVVILGGEIIEIRNLKEGTEIEVLQKPLGAGRAPRFVDTSEGRFFVTSPTFLDPAVYRPGRRVTVVGKVLGSRLRKVGDVERSYPLLEKDHLTLWPREAYPPASPRLSFGVGAIFSR